MAYRPGETVPESGIYRCTKCGNEVTCVMGEPFPPCSKCASKGLSGSEYVLVRKTR